MLVIVLVVVIDSRDVSKKHPSLAFVHVREQRPAFEQQRSKFDNEHDDEHEYDLGSKSHERHSWFGPFLVVLVVVIDSREASKKHPSIVFVHVREQRPAFDPATVKAR